MKRFRNWLIMKFLPAWAKEKARQEQETLKAEIAKRNAEIERLNAYIAGLEAGIRAHRRVVVHNEVTK